MVDTTLIALANTVSAAAVQVNAASDTWQFYGSKDSWVCFGNTEVQAGNLSGLASGFSPKLFQCADAPTASATATALNAVMSPVVSAQQSAAQTAAAATYATAQAALVAYAPKAK